MYKRGQVALFVIIAILIVSAAFTLLYTQTELFKKAEANPEIAPVESFIKNCVKSTGEDALIFIGQQGGYYELPKLSVSGYSYYFYDNKSVMPSKEKIESELSKYMNEMLPFCTQNFVDFPDFNVEANPNAVRTKTTIIRDKVIFDIEWQVLIKKADSTYRLSSFLFEIPSRLNTIYAVVQNMTLRQLEDPSSICLSCLTNFEIQNDLYIYMNNYGNDTVIFTISDNKTWINKNPYEFVFANKYG